MGLYVVMLFSTFLRPSALLQLYTDDVVQPKSGDIDSRHILLLAPVDKERATKTEQWDETCILDGDLVPNLGQLLDLHIQNRLEDVGDVGESLVPLWDFSGRDVAKTFMGAVTALGLREVDTLYQCRHGGASRDMLRKKRSAIEIQQRLHHASQASTRIYNQPGKIQKLVNTLGQSERAYAGQMQLHYSDFARSGKFPRPPNVPAHVRLS